MAYKLRSEAVDKESSWHREGHGEQKEVPCDWSTENNENMVKNESAEVGRSKLCKTL